MALATCTNCGMDILYKDKVWVDKTDGDGCIQETPADQVHIPAGMTYISSDGNYGSTEEIAIVDTSEWTEDDWARLDEVSDWDRPALAVVISRSKRH